MSDKKEKAQELSKLEGRIALLTLETRVRLVSEFMILEEKKDILHRIVGLVEKTICEEAVKIMGSRWRASRALGIDLKTLKRKIGHR